MNKSKVIALVLCVLMVVGALVLASCSGCPSGGDCSITVGSYPISYNGASMGTHYELLEFTCEQGHEYHVYDNGDRETVANCAVVKGRGQVRHDATSGKDVPVSAECDC